MQRVCFGGDKILSKCIVCSSSSSTFFCSRENNIYVSCKVCGHVYLPQTLNRHTNSKPTVKKSTHHVTGLKQEWDFSEVKRTQVFKPRLQNIGKYTSPGKLLDIGCSNGAFIEAANLYGWEASGIEPRISSADFARNRGLTVYNEFLQELCFEEGSFNAITMWQVIEHLPDPGDLLAECRRVLTQGGILALSTPNIKSIGWKLLKSDWPAIDPRNHFHLFDIKTLDRIMNTSGFEKCTLDTLDLQPATLKQVRKKIAGKPNSKPRNTVASMASTASPKKMARLFRYRNVINYPLKWMGLGEDLYGVFRRI